MLVYGEILSSYPPGDKRNKYNSRYEYDVMCYFDEGMALCQNVRVASDYEGPDDFCENIYRGTLNEGGKNEFQPDATKAVNRAGTWVIVGFIRDNRHMGFILGSMPHPKNILANNKGNLSVLPAVSAKEAKPQIRKKFNGIFTCIDDTGQYRIQYNGLPKITPDTAPLSELPKVAEKGLMTLDLLNGPVFRVLDEKSQCIAIDGKNQYISINNTTTPLKPAYAALEPLVITEVKALEPPTGQEIRLEKPSKTLWVRSSDKVNIVCKNRLSINEIDLTHSKTQFKVDTEAKSVFDMNQDKIHVNDGNNANFDMHDGELHMLDSGSGKVDVASGTITITDSSSGMIKVADGKILAKDSGSASLKIESSKVFLGTDSAEVVTLALKLVDLFINTVPVAQCAAGPVTWMPSTISGLQEIKSLLTQIKL